MAATNYTPISLYYSATATNTPSAGNLVYGELAINIADGKLYYKNPSNVVTLLAVSGGAITPITNNGVVYINGSGQAVSGSVLTFDGAQLGVNGITVGRGAGAVATNTAVGASVLAGSNSGAGYNTGIGASTLFTNSTGVGNTALGHSAMYANTTGSSNVAIGAYDGSNEPALRFNTTGGSQVAVGVAALKSNTTGSNNVGVGFAALQANTTASNNTAVGHQAGYSNTTGTGSVSLGYQAGYSSSTDSFNTFIGYRAGYTANLNAGSSTLNVAVGVNAGYSLTTGTINNFFGSGVGGVGAGYYVTTGVKNTILGGYSGNQGGLDIRTASNYIVLSDGDGNPRFVDDGTNVLLGGVVNSSGTAGVGFKILTGRPVVVNADTANTTTVYEAYSTGAAAYRFYVGMGGTIFATSIVITAISDQRLKENVRDIDTGLNSIMALKPRRFDWKEGKGQDKKNVAGFIAQEFETVFPECVATSKAGEDGIEYKNINHETLIPTFVKAIQEQQAIIESLKARLDAANL